MIIVGNKLKKIAKKYQIVDAKNIDETSLMIRLDRNIIYIRPSRTISSLTYGQTIPMECIDKIYDEDDVLVLKPHATCLACSTDRIHIPMGYFGFIQTKGSLARLMVSVHFSDGQVDPGFEGKVTLELYNASDFIIKIPYNAAIANLYLFKTKKSKTKKYSGKYHSSCIPTISLSDNKP